MSKNALISVPSGRRAAHVIVASLLLAAAGTASAYAGGGVDVTE